VYTVAKQRELNALRNLLIGAYAEAALLRDSAPQDPLTGVLARSALPDVLAQKCAHAKRLRCPLSLVLFDIQEFSRINEREGNLVGDLVLKELARVLQTTIRQSDTVLRYGGEQFLCFLAGTERTGTEAFIRRVHKACARVSRLRNLRLDFGISVFEPGADPEAVVADAERELAAKRPSTTPAPVLNAPPGKAA
jgi:diguanylate cyclase